MSRDFRLIIVAATMLGAMGLGVACSSDGTNPGSGARKVQLPDAPLHPTP